MRPLQGKAELCRRALCPPKSDNDALKWFRRSETGLDYIAQAKIKKRNAKERHLFNASLFRFS
jgi:hypothetical protein